MTEDVSLDRSTGGKTSGPLQYGGRTFFDETDAVLFFRFYKIGKFDFLKACL